MTDNTTEITIVRFSNLYDTTAIYANGELVRYWEWPSHYCYADFANWLSKQWPYRLTDYEEVVAERYDGDEPPRELSDVRRVDFATVGGAA